MPSLTTRVIEKDIRVDAPAFFAFAARATGPHTGWLREIGRLHASGELPRFTFKMFEGAKLVGYESNPALHVVLKAIEAHMKRSKTRAFGHVQLFGEVDALPRSILLDYFEGKLSFTNPVWHALDLSSVTLDLPAPPAEGGPGVEVGVAYTFRTASPKRAKGSSAVDMVIAAGVAGSTLYVGYPDWVKKKGHTEAYASRAEALDALARWCAKQAASGLVPIPRSPLSELRRSAKGKFPGWSFG